MKPIIEKRFNEFCKDEYYHYINNHKKYSNFNTQSAKRKENNPGKVVNIVIKKKEGF